MPPPGAGGKARRIAGGLGKTVFADGAVALQQRRLNR